MNYYPHHIGDFNSATRHLTRVERSLYRDLIEMYYDTEQPLPADDFDRLARRVIALSEEERSALQYVLEEFFDLDDDVYRHSRCDEEIAKYRANNSAKSKAGKASAEARRKKAQAQKEQKRTNGKQVATGVEQPFNGCATNQEPRTKNQEPIKATPKNKFSDDDLVTAEYFYSSILKVQPDYKKPNLNRWADTVRLMRERDNRTLSDICAVWAFARKDAFWQQNILSAEKLREKYDQLKAKMRAPHATSGSNNQPNRGLDPNDTSWIDPLFDDPSYGLGSPVGSQCGEPGNPPIEGDFSSVDGGLEVAGAGGGSSATVASRVAGGRN